MLDSLIGTKLHNKFTILERVGAGGAGVVYKVRDNLDRIVALKFVKSDEPLTDADTNAFIAEAKKTAMLEHPHIVRVYELDTMTVADQAQVYFSMPYAEGGTLHQQIKAGPLPLAEAERLLRQICDALDFAHSQGVLHLDLKPGNILLDASRNVLVADFGLARLLETTSHVKADTGLGTQSYMPLEQMIGDDVRRYADIYALGISLYEMLVGTRPKRKFTGAQLLVRFDEWPPHLPEQVRAVIDRATQSDPQQRYGTAGELARAFTAAVSSVTPTATPPPAPQPPSPALEMLFSAPASPPPLLRQHLPNADLPAIREALRDMGQHSEEHQDILERELVTFAFRPGGLFQALGYDQGRRDVLLEEKKADVVLRGPNGRPVAVIEFKRPNRSPQDGFDQLRDLYVKKLLPDVGVLCNGRELIIYRRDGENLQRPPLARVVLKDASERDAQTVFNWMGKRTLDVTSLDIFEETLRDLTRRPLAVRNPYEAGGEAFLDRLALRPQTPFGRLVQVMADALPAMLQHSNFTQGAYAFWRRIYARELKLTDAPKAWAVLMPEQPDGESLYHLMFALESSYAVVARLLLARAMENHGLPGLDLTDTLIGALKPLRQRGKLPPVAYAEGLRLLFEYAGQQAFQTIFASDIFDWWHDIAKLPSNAALGEQLAFSILAIFEFDFKPMTGDLLGSLYQRYFDPETRKALGEFYTPPEVVDFILDQVGYTPDKALSGTRLLDPATGSGTFLVHALQRYLQSAQGRPPAQVLRELLGGLKIVAFDVNPFAVLMAQANYAAQIIPLYAEALRDADLPPTLSIPVLRTDSLRLEYREGERVQGGDIEQLLLDDPSFSVSQDEDFTFIRTDLPVQVGGAFIETSIPVPRFEKARREGWVDNAEQYFAALRVLFDAVGDERISVNDLRQRLQAAELREASKLAQYMQPAAAQLAEEMQRLRNEYDDGRFLKTLADLALALVLKSDVQYDYVVGNPPYIRIQNVPESQREKWLRWYEWADGNFDAYIPFLERGIYIAPRPVGPNLQGWLKPGGKLGYICPNRFLLANYAEGLRAKLPDHAAVELLFDLRDSRVFEDALNYPVIITVRRLEEQEQAPNGVPTIRVFDDSRQGATQLLNEAEQLLVRLREGDGYAQGKFADAFPVDLSDLHKQAWLLMPPSERVVFGKLAAAATINDPATRESLKELPKVSKATKSYTVRLEDLTMTQSGAFQGIATGDDTSLIFKLIEDRGDTLLLRPKGAGDAGWQGPSEIEIERAVLRPWLFGRDVERWYIDWDRWFVFFPYAPITALEKRGSTMTRYRLLPSSVDWNTFAKREKYVGDPPLIDKKYPYAWEYVRHAVVEKRLRGRERGRYAATKQEGHLWYGAARPQNLEHFNRSKVIIQIASPAADAAIDDEKFVFQAGGRGGGAYGIVPNQEIISSALLTALMNAHPLDFYLKHISVVFSGKAYSYSDAFIKQLPIKLPLTDAERAQADGIAVLARQLAETKATLRRKQRERMGFPTLQARALPDQPDLYPLEQFVRGTERAKTFRRADVSFDQLTMTGGIAMRFGRSTLELPNQAVADVVKAWVEIQRTQDLRVDDLLAIRLPTSEAACRRLLALLAELHSDITALQRQLNDSEAHLNVLVAAYYSLDADDVQVIEKFLNRF